MVKCQLKTGDESLHADSAAWTTRAADVGELDLIEVGHAALHSIEKNNNSD